MKYCSSLSDCVSYQGIVSIPRQRRNLVPTENKRSEAAKKAALTRKRRAAGKKAAATRKRREAGRKAAATRAAKQKGRRA
jgi:hypothetical protein